MSNFQIYGLNDHQWNEIVKSFGKYDIYYLSNYVKAFKIHGDGDPLLLYYKSSELRGLVVMIKRDIAQFPPFESIIPLGQYYDIVTPYGYGGFLFDGCTSHDKMNDFNKEYAAFIEDEHIISEFVRYHPQLRNAEEMRGISTVIDLGKTISLDLKSKELIWSNITSTNRNMIRKAQKSGIKICHGKDIALFDDFMRIYNSTMDKDHAEAYYYFSKEFYVSIHDDMYENFEMFYALLDEKIVAMSIMIYANKQMHYHLSGSDFEYRNLAPTNLLLYEAACWGCDQGFNTLHLGGGFGSGEDNLFKFKQAFNRNSDNRFSIGKRVFNQEVYEELVSIRNRESSFCNDSSYFPLYRSEN